MRYNIFEFQVCQISGVKGVKVVQGVKDNSLLASFKGVFKAQTYVFNSLNSLNSLNSFNSLNSLNSLNSFNSFNSFKYSLSFMLLLLLPLLAAAQTERRNTYMIGVGPTRIYDTYLSQEHFSGTGLTLLATTQRSKPDRLWSTLMEHQAHFATADDRSADSNEMQGDYSFLIGRLRHFELLPSLSVEVGGMAVANAGFIYNTSNGNNPAQARLSLNIMPTATATWRFRLFHRQMALRYETQLPLVGVMFSPNYGQSYYEIFTRGNYDHNVVPTTFVSAPNMRHQLMADINIGPQTTIRLGYLGDLQQAKVNNLKSHIYSNHFMVGFVKRFTITNYRP